jgi:sulfatase maturation enzyme AslB (radical SAM superfamily)
MTALLETAPRTIREPSGSAGGAAIKTLELILTSQCNLRCSYCFENDKKSGRMEWEVARAALDRALASPEREIRVLFFGGEPLLEFPTLRRAVEHVADNRRRSQRAKFTVITNGLLLGEDELTFLDRHRVHVQVSFDGTPQAQALRGRGTFDVLDRLLDTVRTRHPAMFRSRFSVSITLLSRTIPQLADAVDYFLAKRVQEIHIGAKITHDPAFRQEMIHDLRAQFRRIGRASVAEFARSGRVPVTLLRKERDAPRRPRPRKIAMCGVWRGQKLAVDVDGHSHGCALFASSYQRFTTAFLRDKLEAVALGDVRSSEPDGRLPMYDDAVRATRIFHDKQDKHSSYGRCADCRFLASCSVCPVSIGHQPGNDDPHRVPDLLCAFNLVTLAQRARFPVRRPLFAGRSS